MVTMLATVALALTLQQAPPDVLFIAVDDLNDWITPLAGSAQAKTPNFGRLAKLGVCFTNAHCAAPACHPSRVAVMTGVHPSRSGIYRNSFHQQGPKWREASPILRKATTLSQHFRNHGYRAVGAGKIYHALQWTKGSQNDPATWDEYWPDALRPIPTWVRPKHVPDADNGIGPGRPLGKSQLFGAMPLDVPDDETSDHKVVDWAIEQLKKPRGKDAKPLFCAVGLFRPHIPWEVPRSYFELFPLEKIEIPKHLENDLADTFGHGRTGWHRWVKKNKLWDDLVQGYLASIAYSDRQLGRLLDALLMSPRRDNTIIVLWSDHGMHIGEKENWEKFTLWEESTRVPLFVSAPGRGRGTRCAEPVTLTDLFPTLCELAGLPIPKDQCDGVSFDAQLRDPSAPRKRPALTSFWMHAHKGVPKKDRPVIGHAVRDRRWRYIRYSNGFEELYDHAEDPDEYTNLAKRTEHADTIRRLREFVPRNAAAPTKAGSYVKKKPAGKRK